MTNKEADISGQDAYSKILVLRLRYEQFISELTPATLKQCPVAICYALRQVLNELSEVERSLIPK